MPWPDHFGPLVFYVTDRHALCPDETRAAARLLQTIAGVADAGVDAIQLREKDLHGRALLELAEAAVARGGTAKILVNDRLDVALASGAAGVHLGGQSVPAAQVVAFRKVGRAPARFLIGRSCHSLQEALQVERDGGDYVFFGPVFSTPSKARFGLPQGADVLAAVCRAVRIPVVAIGGITLENARACLSAGAAGVAAIRLFQESDDPGSIVRSLKM
jgi:thiamine-phosphate diphosphorylase